jgi:UDP-N-acetyl-D-glucosamine dehydrogenase
MKKISVIGQGYVGLPLAVTLAEKEFEVFGIDVSQEKVNKLNSGISEVEDIKNDRLSAVIKSRNYHATLEYKYIKESLVVVVCVPTPLDHLGRPDLSLLSNSLFEITKYLQKGTLVVIESTIAPGTTRNFVAPIIQSNSKIKKDEILLAYSPERLDPSNKDWSLENTPKLISGINTKSLELACSFYSSFLRQIEICDTLEIAEMSKLVENSFRLVNISFINELSIICNKFGIEVDKVIKAASTKPYGFMAFYPGIGVGGHCIPVDPIYLSSFAREIGTASRMIDAAVEINNGLVDYFMYRSRAILKQLFQKRILIIGIAYKKNISDIRESSAIKLINSLRAEGAIVNWHDDLVRIWGQEVSTNLSGNFDLAILAVGHDYLDISELGNTPILDTRRSI